jgi:hypothetical protein
MGVVAGGALLMFVVSRLIGLPGYEEHVGVRIGDSFEDYLGIPSLIAEASFVVLFGAVVALEARARALLAEGSSAYSPRRSGRVRTIVLIVGIAVVLIGHVVHLLFFSSS